MSDSHSWAVFSSWDNYITATTSSPVSRMCGRASSIEQIFIFHLPHVDILYYLFSPFPSRTTHPLSGNRRMCAVVKPRMALKNIFTSPNNMHTWVINKERFLLRYLTLSGSLLNVLTEIFTFILTLDMCFSQGLCEHNSFKTSDLRVLKFFTTVHITKMKIKFKMSEIVK